MYPCSARKGVTTCCSHLQCEVVLLAGGDVQQCCAGLTCAEHELYMPWDGGRHRCHVVPLQQTVTQETLRAGHDYSKKMMMKINEERELYSM